MAFSGVEGAISGDAGNLLIRRDLVEQLGQHGRIAHITGGEFGGPDLPCFLVNTDMDLAPDTALRAAMLAGAPFTFTFELVPRAVDQKMQRTC